MPVTIMELALYRLGLPEDTKTLNGADFARADLEILGGCEICGASIAAYNACPSKSGYWRCLNGCIGDDGWSSVASANRDIFGEEEGNEDGSNRDVPPYDNDPRSDDEIKQEVYDRWARGEQDDDYGEEDR